jgi:hypothetical protein
MRAAWKMEAKADMARIRNLAEWLEREYPSAAASLREGLEECFTINRLGVPPSLQRCLATTNIIESPHAGVRIRTRRLTNWQNGSMARRWIASTFASTSVALRCAASLPLRLRRNRPDFSITQHCRCIMRERPYIRRSLGAGAAGGGFAPAPPGFNALVPLPIGVSVSRRRKGDAVASPCIGRGH